MFSRIIPTNKDMCTE